jgi:ribosomal protein S27E
VAFLVLLPQSGSFRTMEIRGGTTMLAQGRDGLGETAYERHQPEQTLLYQLVEAHYSTLVDQLAQQGKSLPDHVHREFEAYLKCGRLEHGFLRVRCDKCHFERLVAFSCKKRGFCPSCGARRMAETAALLADEVFPDVPLRQWVISFPFPLRYLFAAHPQAMGKVLGIVYRAISTHLIHKAGFNLKDWRYRCGNADPALRICPQPQYTLSHPVPGWRLRISRQPTTPISTRQGTRQRRVGGVGSTDQPRVGRCLERQGLLEQDTESAWLDLDPAEDTDAMPQILGSSISYRIAVGPQQGRKAFMIRTIRPLDRPDPRLERVAKANGFSLHAGAVSCEGHERRLSVSACVGTSPAPPSPSHVYR